MLFRIVCAQVINSLPDVDVPALFGLPANINRAAQVSNSQLVVSKLRQMSVSQAAVAGFDRKKWAQQLAPLFRLWEQLVSAAPASLKTGIKEAAQALRTKSSAPKTPNSQSGEGAAPVDAFILLQRRLGLHLVAIIDRTLSQMLKVLKGQEALTAALQSVGTALMADSIPGAWDAAWEGPSAPAEYIQVGGCCGVVLRAATAGCMLIESVFRSGGTVGP